MTASGKKIGVVLAGCGYLDGVEIHEATLTLLALDRLGADIVTIAPDKPQAHIVDHQKGEEAEGARNVLAESARIARGNVTPLASVNHEELDAPVGLLTKKMKAHPARDVRDVPLKTPSPLDLGAPAGKKKNNDYGKGRLSRIVTSNYGAKGPLGLALFHEWRGCQRVASHSSRARI